MSRKKLNEACFLSQDIPQPVFMTTKPEEEWSEDEKRLVQDYQRKVRELNEERDKYRKVLLRFFKDMNIHGID